MDLSFLIPSKTRRMVIDYFVVNPEAQVAIRELARELKIPPQQIFRELCNLESWGMLFSNRRGTERVFRLNQRFPLFPPVRQLFQKLREENNDRPKVDRVLEMKPRAYAEEKIMKRKGML